MAAVKVPATSTITNSGMLIQVAGEAVGAITGWNVRISRDATECFEFGSLTTGGGDDIPADAGEAFEIVPGNSRGNTISIRRYDLYTKRFENAFKTNSLEMLTKQDKSIRLIEFNKSPDGSLDMTMVYYGCWFTSLGRQHAADGNRIVLADAEVKFTRRRQIQ